ncbi:MAG: M55 family metallopeptidase [Deltaproteobacteria bacterium]|nr:M55 family metallopeptidase [Deltaproteobacteria bacterium]MBW2123140.1 M55 family metallopeptidase [Deltaproteobacteria bacterium]
MKVFISADMEGATGVTNMLDVVEGKPGYERFRKMMTGDVNAAIDGAFEGGATEVLVNDSHYTMRNILLEELDSRASLISGIHKPLCMMEGIDSTFDAAFFVGYHAKAGTGEAVANHTLLGREIISVRLNGEPIGETQLNAAIAGYYDVPVVMVAGDDKVTREAKSVLGNVETAVVKEGIDRWTARCYPPKETGRRIREAAGNALKKLNQFKPLKVEGEVKLEIEFMSTSEAALPTLFPGVVREDSRTVSVTDTDFIRAFKAFLGCMLLGWTASDELYG